MGATRMPGRGVWAGGSDGGNSFPFADTSPAQPVVQSLIATSLLPPSPSQETYSHGPRKEERKKKRKLEFQRPRFSYVLPPIQRLRSGVLDPSNLARASERGWKWCDRLTGVGLNRDRMGPNPIRVKLTFSPAPTERARERERAQKAEEGRRQGRKRRTEGGSRVRRGKEGFVLLLARFVGTKHRIRRRFRLRLRRRSSAPPLLFPPPGRRLLVARADPISPPGAPPARAPSPQLVPIRIFMIW